MARSKTIKLFLMDGKATGRIKCSLANWTGIAYKIPRTALDKCKDIKYLQQSGVYFLFGTDEMLARKLDFPSPAVQLRIKISIHE